MRMTITVEDAGPPTLTDDTSADTIAEAATPPLDAGAAFGAATAEEAPRSDGTTDGGHAPSWLVELLEGLDSEADAAAPTATDAGAGPSG